MAGPFCFFRGPYKPAPFRLKYYCRMVNTAFNYPDYPLKGSEFMNGRRFSENKARRNGFYLALAVCLVAVGIAAWSTFDAVQGYISATEELESQSSVSSGRSDDPQAQKSPAPSGKPQAGAAARPSPTPAATPAPKPTYVPKPSSPPAAESPEPADTEPQEPQVPVNAPMYEISEEMIYPVSGETVQKAYSAGAPVYSETMKDWRIHAGTDFEAQSGEQVLACGNGIVKETYTDSMLGNVAVIEHGDYVFSYCGLGENFLVKPEDVVTMGQAIGTVTAVPAESADRPHLHLEVRKDSAYLDPTAVIEGKD